MNCVKITLFIAGSLMMNMVVQGMEVERFISRDDLFVWTNEDKQYHAITEEGDISERVLQKNDQKQTIYKAQLVIKKDDTYCLRTTQELTNYYMGAKFRNMMKFERLLIPISFSQKQGEEMLDAYHRYKSTENNSEVILVQDNKNNVYCITHMLDERVDNSKKVKVYDTNKFRNVQVSLLPKKKAMLKIQTLEEEISQLKQCINKSLEKFQELQQQIDTSIQQKDIPDLFTEMKNIMNQQYNNFLQNLVGGIGVISFAALCAFLLYKHDQLVAFFNHQYQG